MTARDGAADAEVVETGAPTAARPPRWPAHSNRLSPLGYLLVALVTAYRWTLGPLLPPSCRFTPTCSEYALLAVREHGAIRGGWLAVRRVARCSPLCAGGYDPVPPKRTTSPARRMVETGQDDARAPARAGEPGGSGASTRST